MGKWKVHSSEEIIRKLRQAEVLCSGQPIPFPVEGNDNRSNY